MEKPLHYIAFTRVRKPFGWLGNMAAYPVYWDNKEYKTTEALFQAMRFKDFPEIAEKIRLQLSPMSAKELAVANKPLLTESGYELLGSQDIENMKLCLSLKLQQHFQLSQMLIETHELMIIEDCSSRPHGTGLFWGAMLQNGQWVGQNVLGKLWMEQRQKLNLEKKNQLNF